MNYKPFVGYYFYGAANSTERAAYFCSWGLLRVAPYVIREVIKDFYVYISSKIFRNIRSISNLIFGKDEQIFF